MSLLTKIIDLIFPDRPFGNRAAFDFRNMPHRQLARAPPAAAGGKSEGKYENRIAACLSYKDPPVRDLIRKIKTKKDRHAFAGAAALLCKKLEEPTVTDAACQSAGRPILVLMPISRKRRFERGYNQCELLVREMKRRGGGEMNARVLRRNGQNGNSKKQAFKKRAERISEMRGAFSADLRRLKKIPDFENRHFILIDDVITTGSTMNEAILTLRRVGCRNVSGIALAH